jgi:MFS superfamily sulfate permease-like transporter
VNLDPTTVVPWSSDWLWSLPLSVMAVIIHVAGLYLIKQRFDRVLADATRRNMKIVALLFMAGTTVSVTLLHGLEAGVWAMGFRWLRALPDNKSAMLYSLNAMTTFGHSGMNLETHWQLMGALEALNGLILFGLSTAFLFAIIQEAWNRLGKQPLREPVLV